MEIHQKTSIPNYQKLKTMVKNGNIRNSVYETLAPSTGELNLDQCQRVERYCQALKEEKVCVFSGKKKASVRKGDQCSFWHESNDRAQKPEHTAATPSEPALSRGRSVSRKRSIRGKSNHGSILRQPCRYYLKFTCTRTPCEYWHPPECQLYETKAGGKPGDTYLFPHFKVDEQPHTRPKKGYFPKRRESEDKGAVAIVKSVSQLGCVSQDSDALASQGTKEFRRNPMHKVLNATQRSSIH